MAKTACQQAADNLALLNGLLVGGVARITHGDKTTEFRAASRHDLMREREYWQRKVDACNGTTPDNHARRFVTGITPTDC